MSSVYELSTALSNLVVGIVLASGVYKLSGTLTISYSVIIEAEVPGSVVLDAKGSASTKRRVFNVQSSGAAELIGLNITGGYAREGGGVCVWGTGTATLINSNIYDNLAAESGGGLMIWGTATLTNTNVYENVAYVRLHFEPS